MRKITIGIISVVAVVAVAFLVFAGAIAGAMQWDGWTSRQITVIVQASDGSPIPGALITFRDRWYDLYSSIPLTPLTEEERQNWQEEQQNWQSQHSASGPTETDGSFTFRGMFSAGGTRTLFWDNGRFILSGFISVQAEGYQTVESDLSSLVGQSSISVRRHRRKPIIVRCSLKKKEPHKNRLNNTTEGAPSVEG
ncbi:MAG: hypothetical protein ACYSWO_12985 [Planctomycetota bacterium]|jgi:hypothetical protein